MPAVLVLIFLFSSLLKGVKGLSPFLRTGNGGADIHSFLLLLSHSWNASVSPKVMLVG